MKLQLIMLPDRPILVSDEKKTIDDTVFSVSNNDFFKLYNDRYPESQIEELNQSKNYKKIIAGIPGIPSIDFSALSEEDCKNIGRAHSNDEWISELTKDIKDEHTLKTAKLCLRAGFNKAQSLNEKKFSEEDIRVAMFYALNKGIEIHNNTSSQGNDIIGDYIHSLSQPKVFDVEVEVEDSKIVEKHEFDGTNDGEITWVKQPKITENSIKITKVL